MKRTDVSRNVSALMSKLSTETKQSNYYKMQKDAIKQLEGEDAFQRVIERFEFEVETLSNKLVDTKASNEDMRYIQGRLSIAKDFLSRVNNLK